MYFRLFIMILRHKFVRTCNFDSRCYDSLSSDDFTKIIKLLNGGQIYEIRICYESITK